MTRTNRNRGDDLEIPVVPTPSFPTGAGWSDTSWLRDAERAGLGEAQESLDTYETAIGDVNNRGAGRRLEDAMAFSRGSSLMAAARAGIDPGSFQGAQLVADAQGNTISDAFSHEGEREAQLRQFRAGEYGKLAQVRTGLFSTLGGLQAQSRQIDQADRELSMREAELRLRDRAQQQQLALALAELQLAQLSSPTWTRMAGIDFRPGHESSGGVGSLLTGSGGGIGPQITPAIVGNRGTGYSRRGV